jgi:hypothetical protein
MKLDAARRIALALPEATEAPHHQYTSFRVGGKIFATAPPAGDALHVFVDDDERERALALQPDCTEKLLWGGKVVGLRVSLAAAPAAFVRQLLAQAWRRKAPKHLLDPAP